MPRMSRPPSPARPPPPEVHHVRLTDGYKNKMLEGTQWLHENREFTDFTIKTHDGEIQCHKHILSAQSPVIKAMLELDMTESQQQSVTIDYFPTHIVEKLVRFMYDGKVTVDHEHLEEVIIAADYLQVYKLTEKCLDACEQNPGFVRGDNAIRFREVAEQVELGELAMTAKKKLVLCFFDFLHSESLLQLDYIEIGRLIKELEVDRVHKDYLVDAVLRWVHDHSNDDPVDWLTDDDVQSSLPLVTDQWIVVPEGPEVLLVREYNTLTDKEYNEDDDHWMLYNGMATKPWKEHKAVLAARAEKQKPKPREKPKFPSTQMSDTFHKLCMEHLAKQETRSGADTQQKTVRSEAKEQPARHDEGTRSSTEPEQGIKMDTERSKSTEDQAKESSTIPKQTSAADQDNSPHSTVPKLGQQSRNAEGQETSREKPPDTDLQQDDDSQENATRSNEVRYVSEQYDTFLASKRFKSALGVELLKLISMKHCSLAYLRLLMDLQNGNKENIDSLIDSAHVLDPPDAMKKQLQEAFAQVKEIGFMTYNPKRPLRLAFVGGRIKHDDRDYKDDYRDCLVTYNHTNFQYLPRVPPEIHPRFSCFVQLPMGFMVAGGNCKHCFVYDGMKREYVKEARMAIKKEKHTMAYVNNRVYLIGGYAHHAQWYRQVEFYDFSDKHWHPGPDTPEQFHNPFATGLADRVYVMHGYKNFSYLDAVAFKWREAAPLPQELPESRIANDGSRIYVSGGSERKLFAYTPEDDTWKELSPPRHEHRFGALCFYNQRLLLSGGVDVTKIEEYSIERDIWTDSSMKLSQSLSHHFAISLECVNPRTDWQIMPEEFLQEIDKHLAQHYDGQQHSMKQEILRQMCERYGEEYAEHLATYLDDYYIDG